MICDGGCVGGPSAFDNPTKSKETRDGMLSKPDNRGIHENLTNYDMNAFSMHRNH